MPRIIEKAMHLLEFWKKVEKNQFLNFIEIYIIFCRDDKEMENETLVENKELKEKVQMISYANSYYHCWTNLIFECS